MAVEYANEDLKLNFSLSGGPGDASYAGDQGLDTTKIVGQKSSKVNCPGGSSAKKLCHTDITLTFSGSCPFSSATYTFDGGGGSISMSKITKSTTESNKPDGKDDQGSCKGGWHLTAFPYTSIPCSCTVKIADAGQTDVKGE